MGYKESDKKPVLSSDSPDSVRRKIRLGWVGLFTWLFIFSNAIRYTLDVPILVMIVGYVLHITMITFLIIHIRKDYKKLRKGQDSGA